MPAKSLYLRNAVLSAVFQGIPLAPSGPWLGLHTADPGLTGAAEVTRGAYARQPAAFGPVANGAVANAEDVDFAGMPAVTLTHIGVWDSVAGGNLLYAAEIAVPKATNAGDTFRVLLGDVDITEN